MSTVLDIAKVTSKGQITIPADIRSALGVRSGDKVLFVQADDGSVVLQNSNLQALERAQRGFDGAAAEVGLKDEDDLMALIKNVRADRAVRKK
jgi:antitoxin PrlF